MSLSYFMLALDTLFFVPLRIMCWTHLEVLAWFSLLVNDSVRVSIALNVISFVLWLRWLNLKRMTWKRQLRIRFRVGAFSQASLSLRVSECIVNSCKLSARNINWSAVGLGVSPLVTSEVFASSLRSRVRRSFRLLVLVLLLSTGLSTRLCWRASWTRLKNVLRWLVGWNKATTLVWEIFLPVFEIFLFTFTIFRMASWDDELHLTCTKWRESFSFEASEERNTSFVHQ